MLFKQKLAVDIEEVQTLLGYTGPPDTETLAAITAAAKELEAQAIPRWCSRETELKPYGPNIIAVQLGVTFRGQSIARHLKGCTACIGMAVTLGTGVDTLLRIAAVSDVHRAVLLDACASVLVEQYAGEVQAILHENVEQRELYATARFSPGYGDFDIAIQQPLVTALDAPRAIGLTASESGTLLPRKSITALIGVAKVPVKGYLANCDVCAARDTCKRATPCGG